MLFSVSSLFFFHLHYKHTYDICLLSPRNGICLCPRPPHIRTQPRPSHPHVPDARAPLGASCTCSCPLLVIPQAVGRTRGLEEKVDPITFLFTLWLLIVLGRNTAFLVAHSILTCHSSLTLSPAAPHSPWLSALPVFLEQLGWCCFGSFGLPVFCGPLHFCTPSIEHAFEDYMPEDSFIISSQFNGSLANYKVLGSEL